MNAPRFNEVNRSIDQLRQQLSTIDSEIDRVESDSRRVADEAKSKIRALKNAAHDALEFCDEVRQGFSQAQREVSFSGAEHGQQAYGGGGGGVGLDPQRLAWELTQVITRSLQQAGVPTPGFMAGGNAGRPQAQT